MDRRGFLIRTGLTFAAGALAGPALGDSLAEARLPRLDDWDGVRAQFSLAPELVHFGGLYLASHPAPVREAIERHRRELDHNPVHYLQDQGARLEAAVLRAAAGHLGTSPTEIALTDSTTMGLGLLYGGLRLGVGQEVLTTRHDFYATHESLRLAAERSGATVRSVALYDAPAAAAADEIVARIVRAVGPATRLVAVTWVHSSTGVKLPIRAIADALAAINADRGEPERVLLSVDGVHGLGVEDSTLVELGCDFFVAGCHKWLFGPRGTGLVWGHPQAWPAVAPTIPTFSGEATPGALMTPGGFHSFEHRWALAEAFAFHQAIGPRRVADRIHALSRQLKEGLAALPNVVLYTPMDERLSAGLVCFDVIGLSPRTVVARLRERGIVATTTPYAPSYARLAPALFNTPEEIDRVLGAIRALR